MIFPADVSTHVPMTIANIYKWEVIKVGKQTDQQLSVHSHSLVLILCGLLKENVVFNIQRELKKWSAQLEKLLQEENSEIQQNAKPLEEYWNKWKVICTATTHKSNDWK